MKRNMKLIWMILEYIEAVADGMSGVDLDCEAFKAYTKEDISYHVQLCHDAGYLQFHGRIGLEYSLMRLTWHGHDALKEFYSNYSLPQ